MNDDDQWMTQALALAQQAYEQGEVPIGAVLVHQGEMVGKGYNQVIQGADPTLHAEIVALRHGAAQLKNYRLVGTTLYVTLEPCMMCLGALLHARITRLVVGALDPKVGALQWLNEEGRLPGGNHTIQVTQGVYAEEASTLLSNFFKERRAMQTDKRTEHPAHQNLQCCLESTGA